MSYYTGTSTLRINKKPFAVRKAKHSKDFLVSCIVCSNKTIVSLIRAKEYIKHDKEAMVKEHEEDDELRGGWPTVKGSLVYDGNEDGEGSDYIRWIAVKCSYCAKPADVEQGVSQGHCNCGGQECERLGFFPLRLRSEIEDASVWVSLSIGIEIGNCESLWMVWLA